MPIRTCVVCATKVEKKFLTRLVISEGQQVSMDEEQSRNGRGAYICKKTECRKNIGLRDRFSGSLRIEIDRESWTALVEQLP